MKQNISNARRGSTPLRRLALAAGILALPLAGCEEILDVEQPDITLPDNFVDETALPAIRAAAIGDFSIAYSGSTGGNSQILYSGLLADEWIHSGTFPTRKEIDVRNILQNNSTLQDVTRTLYRARTSAETARANFEALGANTVGHAEVTNLAGYSYILFGENYCSGVPFSEVNESGGFEFGDPESTDQIFQDRAVARFQEAIEIAEAAESATQENLARIGLGRALLNLGQYQAAAEAVASVPTDFVYWIEHSTNTTREQNVVWNFNFDQERFSAADEEGGNGLPYLSDEDPRVPWVLSSAEGFDGETPVYAQLKYPNRDSDVPLATGAEARLIEAEAALQAGDMGEFLAIHEALRATVDLGPLDIDGLSEDEVVDLHFQERAYWLWLTSHRLGDLRRLIRQYDRAEDEVFPTGSYFKTGEPYGDAVSLLLPVDELNNPNAVQCDNTIA